MAQLFLCYVNITKLLNYFEIICSQKLIRSLADIAEHICQIERKSPGNVFLKRTDESLLVAVVIKVLMISG